MKTVAAIICFVLLFVNCTFAQSWQVSSPNGKIRATVQLIVADGSLQYFVEYIDNNQTIVEASKLGLSRIDQSFTQNFVYENQSTATIDENYSMVIGKKLQLRNNANELTLNFHNASNSKLQIIFRAYNDGVAFRYRFPETSNTTFYVTEDKTTFQLPLVKNISKFGFDGSRERLRGIYF